jgi:hypothetical protein
LLWFGNGSAPDFPLLAAATSVHADTLNDVMAADATAKLPVWFSPVAATLVEGASFLERERIF